jgi:hypothetical protein
LALPILIVFGSMPEAEVYAISLFILLFWLGLRWEQDMDSPRGNRWLLSFLTGYWIIGVHFMAL